jgi:hypothetical protein
MIRVQRNSLKSLLGDDLYDDVTATSPTISYTNLLPYIYNYCSAAFVAKFCVEGSLFHTNRGNFDFEQDTTQNPAKWQLQQVTANYKEEQNNYANDIIEFLDDNVATYTLWKSDKAETDSFDFVIV